MITLSDIAARMEGQDNLATEAPVFLVQQRRRIYGMDPQYADDSCIAWLLEDEAEELEANEAVLREAEYERTGEVPDGLRRVAYVDVWESVQPFLSRAGADRFIEGNRHRLTAPRVYVDSAYRNDEWVAVRAALLAVQGRQGAITKEEFAAKLDGRDIGGNVVTPEEAIAAKEAGLVVVWGEADDSVMVVSRGADEEVLASDTVATILLGPAGEVVREVDCGAGDDEVLARYDAYAYAVERAAAAKRVSARWCHKEGEPLWTFATEVPHATFDVPDSVTGGVFCRGIVIDISDLR